jgi:hypothetical protein
MVKRFEHRCLKAVAGVTRCIGPQRGRQMTNQQRPDHSMVVVAAAELSNNAAGRAAGQQLPEWCRSCEGGAVRSAGRGLVSHCALQQATQQWDAIGIDACGGGAVL